MAANFKAGSLGKRIAGQILAGKRSGDPNPVTRSVVVAHYSSTYDKNVEEQVRPAVVPDHVIGYSGKGGEEKYWAPHPETGVFGPTNKAEGGGGVATRVRVAPGNGGTESVLDQTAWFRPLEVADVEKPHN